MKLKSLFFLSLVILFTSSFNKRAGVSRPKIIYVYDTLCGWCFGFSPVMEKMHAEYRNSFDFEIISGGLKIGDQVGSINEVAPFIKTAYKDLEKATGVKFGEKFINGNLASGEMILNSMLPAVALCIVKKTMPAKALAYSRLLHQGIYIDNHAPEDSTWYGEYAEKIGIVKPVFDIKMKDAYYGKLAMKDFFEAKALDATAFPTVFLLKDGKYTVIASGYTDYKTLKRNLLKAMRK